MTTPDRPENLDRILRRVQKLLALAADTRADPNEAAAAASQAENIMRKFQIEHADVVQAELLRAENFDGKDVPSGLSKMAQGWTLWAQTLALAVAALHDCQVRKSWKNGAALQFVGYTSDTQVAQWTYLYLLGCIRRDAKDFKKRHPLASRQNMDAFRLGYVCSLRDLLEEATKRKKQEMEGGAGSRALVISKAQAVSNRFGEAKVKTKDSKAAGAPGFTQGALAGSKVNIDITAIKHDQDPGPLLIAK